MACVTCGWMWMHKVHDNELSCRICTRYQCWKIPFTIKRGGTWHPCHRQTSLCGRQRTKFGHSLLHEMILRAQAPVWYMWMCTGTQDAGRLHTQHARRTSGSFLVFAFADTPTRMLVLVPGDALQTHSWQSMWRLQWYQLPVSVSDSFWTCYGASWLPLPDLTRGSNHGNVLVRLSQRVESDERKNARDHRDLRLLRQKRTHWTWKKEGKVQSTMTNGPLLKLER